MRRGTTPKHTFTLPFDTATIEKIRVIYAQRDAVVFEKKESDVHLVGNEVRVTLTQADTLKLQSAYKTEIQIRVLTKSGQAFASDIVSVNTDRCMTDEVL